MPLLCFPGGQWRPGGDLSGHWYIWGTLLWLSGLSGWTIRMLGLPLLVCWSALASIQQLLHHFNKGLVGLGQLGVLGLDVQYVGFELVDLVLLGAKVDE